jgi:hypothetical protein
MYNIYVNVVAGYQLTRGETLAGAVLAFWGLIRPVHVLLLVGIGLLYLVTPSLPN